MSATKQLCVNKSGVNNVFCEECECVKCVKCKSLLKEKSETITSLQQTISILNNELRQLREDNTRSLAAASSVGSIKNEASVSLHGLNCKNYNKIPTNSMSRALDDTEKESLNNISDVAIEIGNSEFHWKKSLEVEILGDSHAKEIAVKLEPRIHDTEVKEEIDDDYTHIEFESYWNYPEVKEEGNIFKTEEDKQTLEELDDQEQEDDIVEKEKALFKESEKSSCNFLTCKDGKVDLPQRKLYAGPECSTSFRLGDSGGRSFHCAECSKIFPGKRHIRNHMRMHYSGRPFQCAKCKNSFTFKSLLIKHMQTHTGEKPFNCAECMKSFSRKTCLMEHMRKHSDVKLFDCAECKKSFSSRLMLSRHMQTHADEKHHHCAKCKKSFTWKHDLIRHMRIHSGEKPFLCVKCKESFTRKDRLTEHMRKHTVKNLFCCALCNKFFTRKEHLKNHMKRHEKHLQCPECKERFNHKASLKKHMRLHTGHKPLHCKQNFNENKSKNSLAKTY